jgi:hypothetical protein
MSRLVIIYLVCLVGMLGCKTDEERCLSSGGKILNAVEARQVYLGNTMTGEMPSQNMQFQVHYAADGAMSGRVTIAGASDTDKGAFAISGNGMLCTRWVKWQAFNGCIAIYKDGNIFKVFNQANGELLTTQKMLKGDPLKLAAPPPPPIPPATPTAPATSTTPAQPAAPAAPVKPVAKTAPTAPAKPEVPTVPKAP